MRCLILFSVLIVLVQCTPLQSDEPFNDYDRDKVPYAINSPSKTMALHYDLEEISGLSYYDESTLLCVQDESGKVYFIDNESGEIKKELKFGKGGDYEGVEILNERIYVVASNGKLTSFLPDNAVEATTVSTSLSIKNDVEGLGLLQGKLTLYCKADGAIEDNKAKGKVAYFFDSDLNELVSSPAFSFKVKDLQKFIKHREHFNTLQDFDPSGVAEHPVTNDVYIVTADRALLVLSPDFEIKELVKLNRVIYKQPEGICFSPDGTLYISNEGDGARAKLVKIDYIRP
ncbi:MAG: hypothetical protein AAGA02_02615 [Bacteroidota bacterium]